MNKKLIFIFTLLALVSLPALAQDDTAIASQGYSFTSILRGLLGITILVGLGFIISSRRKAINWRVIGTGLAVQFIIALIVLKVPVFQYMIEIVGAIFLKILEFTQEGTSFLLRSFISEKVDSPMINFAFWILPTIIFFSAITCILF